MALHPERSAVAVREPATELAEAMAGVDCARRWRFHRRFAHRDDIRSREHQQRHNQGQQRNYQRGTTHRRRAQLDGYQLAAGRNPERQQSGYRDRRHCGFASVD